MTHGTHAEERSAFLHDHLRCGDVAADDAGAVEFDGFFGVEIAFDRAIDLHAASGNVSPCTVRWVRLGVRRCR